MSEFIRLQANGVDAYPDASTENTYRSNGTSVESALLALESNVNTLGGVAGEAKTLAEQNSVKIETAEQEISDINSSLESIKIKTLWTNPELDGTSNLSYFSPQTIEINGISDYDIIGICHSNYAKELTRFNFELNIPNKNQVINITFSDYDSEHYIAGYNRNFTILENGISFNSAYAYWINGKTENNGYAIPIKIIGIKL